MLRPHHPDFAQSHCPSGSLPSRRRSIQLAMATSSAAWHGGGGGGGEGPTSTNPGERRSEEDIPTLRHTVDDIVSKTDELEQRVNEVVRFYATKKHGSNAKGCSAPKESGNANHSGGSGAKKLPDGLRKEGVCTKRMKELMRQFGTILKQISQHKWAHPFMEPVDVEGLGLHDYYEVIKKPMDFSTIRNQMEAKDGSGYKHVREIYADVRLVFTNAMTYNEDRSDVHVMAKTLLDKFEEKWLQLLPKVLEEETRQKEEETQDLANMQIAHEANIAKIARETNNELNKLNMHLEELRAIVLQKCRKMSVYEKRKLGLEISSLSTEDLDRALEIIAQDNTSFQATTNATEIDLDAQSQSTLWKLKFFVKGALAPQSKSAVNKADENLKRKKEICDALAKTVKKRSKKLP